jgi:hypothetical protein
MNNDKEKYQEYFEILELEANASLADINRSYKKLKELYSSESMATDPIEDEFPQEERQEIVNQLEEAYKALLNLIVQRDRVEKQTEKIEEKIEDTIVEEREKTELELEEEEVEGEEVFILGLEEEERIGNNEFQAEILPEESYDTNVAPGREDMPVSVHENEDVHEHVHIELPEKEDIPEKQEIEIQYPQKNSLEIVLTDVDKDIGEKKRDRKKTTWAETLFEKDLEEIKKELTRDMKADSTIAKKKSGDVQAGKEGVEGLKIKGNTLREVREKLGLGIHEIAVKTKINYKILVNIEKDRFSKLPDAGHLRWYLTTYAKALFLDPQYVSDEYMKHYREWKRTRGEML